MEEMLRQEIQLVMGEGNLHEEVWEERAMIWPMFAAFGKEV
jgi:hypothetical protein